ncbi:MAG TPA: hypothetical protein DDZ39_08120, partial [Flavobacteriaceae bacterium]|nr:hypothetical protein [Flavobacteriaceae bacterium]
GTDFVKRWNENWIPPSERTPYQPKEITDEFYLSIKHLNNKKTFVAFGIPAFSGTPENKNIEFEMEIKENDIDDFQIEFLHNNKVIETYTSGSQVLDEVVVKGKGPGNNSSSNTSNNQNTQSNYSVGKYNLKWDGFDSNGIYDSTIFTSGKLKARIKGKRNGKEKTAESDEFSFDYKEVNWVDTKINKNTKRIDVTLRVNLKDGGEVGTEKDCQKVGSGSYAPERTICPWDKIPEKEIKKHGEPLKKRLRDFQSLEKLAIEGVNSHWSRNNIDINEDKYEVFVNTINTTKNTMDDLDIVYNTNSFWGRSNNPGNVSTITSFFANLAEYIPYVPLNETIYYNVGYVNNLYKFESQLFFKEDYWIYLNPLNFYKKKSNIDRDFSYTAAHELGHTILKAFAEKGGGDTDHSYKHKGSSDYSNTTPVSEGGENYPHSSGEIDLMKYYNNSPIWYDFDRIVASQEDVLGLLWLTKLELK